MAPRPSTEIRSAQAAELRDWYLLLRRKLVRAAQERRVSPGKAEVFDRRMLDWLG
jgi:hypothetical protein